MIKVKHRGAVSRNEIEFALKKYNYKILNYCDSKDLIKVIISKDFSKEFNVKFAGNITIEVTVFKNMYDFFCVFTYPKFKEIS